MCLSITCKHWGIFLSHCKIINIHHHDGVSTESSHMKFLTATTSILLFTSLHYSSITPPFFIFYFKLSHLVIGSCAFFCCIKDSQDPLGFRPLQTFQIIQQQRTRDSPYKCLRSCRTNLGSFWSKRSGARWTKWPVRLMPVGSKFGQTVRQDKQVRCSSDRFGQGHLSKWKICELAQLGRCWVSIKLQFKYHGNLFQQ